MSQSKVPTYLGLAAVGAGAFYLYRAGGDPKTATQDMKHDAYRASGKIPEGERAAGKFSDRFGGQSAGKEGAASLDEALNSARDAAGKTDERFGELAHKAGEQIDGARERFNSNVDSIDRKVEEKAAEAKGGLSGWFSGGNGSGGKK